MGGLSTSVLSSRERINDVEVIRPWLPGIILNLCVGMMIMFVVSHRVHRPLVVAVWKYCGFDSGMVVLNCLWCWYTSTFETIQLHGGISDPGIVFEIGHNFLLHAFFGLLMGAVDALRIRPISKKTLLVFWSSFAVYKVFELAFRSAEDLGWHPEERDMPLFDLEFWFLDDSPRRYNLGG